MLSQTSNGSCQRNNFTEHLKQTFLYTLENALNDKNSRYYTIV